VMSEVAVRTHESIVRWYAWRVRS